MELKLKQEFGLFTGASFITGCIIGSGIFISPTPVLAGAGGSFGLALFIWLGAGILTILGSLSFIELALLVRKSGGIYTFLYEGFGNTFAFVYLWTDLFVMRPLSASLAMQATGRYILRPLFLDCQQLSPRIAENLLGLLVLYIFLAMNMYSMKYTKFIINGITVCKVGALILIIIGGIIQLGEGKTSHFSDPFKIEEIVPEKLLFSFYTAIYAYYGGNLISGLYEEIKHPNRSLVLATIIGHLIPIVTYLMANVAYYAVLTKEEILSGITVAVIFGERRLGPFKWVILPCVAISTSGIINNNIIASSRSTFVAARDGKFPRVFSLISINRKTPIPALLVMVMITTVVVLTFDLMSLLKIYTFLRTLYDSIAIAGLFKIRRKFNREGVLKLPVIIPVAYLVGLLFCVVNSVIFSPKIILFSAAAIGTAIIAKIVLYFGKDSDTQFGQFLSRFAEFLEQAVSKLFLCGRSETDIIDSEKLQ